MSYPTYGRYAVAEPPSNLALLHLHAGAKLKTVDHEPKIAVLDQSDLIKQGIYTDELIPGAKRVDALGSCTANSFIEHLSTILTLDEFVAYVTPLASAYGVSYEDTVSAEKAAIAFYHVCSDQTGDPSTEWPPTDCGSSGVYVANEAFRQKIVSSQQIAHDLQSVCSLLQRNGVLWGTPFFNVWEEPGAAGFIDGKGRLSDLQAAIGSGVAGGHELHLSAIEKIAFLPTGQLDLFNTILRFRNHWTASWGDHGSGRVHASTLSWLGSHCDWRQLRK